MARDIMILMRANPLRAGVKKDGRIQIQALFEGLSQHGADEGFQIIPLLGRSISRWTVPLKPRTSKLYSGIQYLVGHA
jgi:hypothetical protein